MTAQAQPVVFVSLTGDEAIKLYDLDAQSGALELRASSPAHGPSGALFLHPTRPVLYDGHVGDSTLASFHLDTESGELTLINKVDTGLDTPAHLITDSRRSLPADGLLHRRRHHGTPLRRRRSHRRPRPAHRHRPQSPRRPADRGRALCLCPPRLPQQQDQPVPLRRQHRPPLAQRPARASSTGGRPRPPAYLLPSARRCRVHRQRAGQHSHRSPLRRRRRHPLHFPRHLDPARGLH